MKMTPEEHNDLMVYLDKLMSQAMCVRPGYDWFMKSNYMALVNNTFSELIILDVLEAGL